MRKIYIGFIVVFGIMIYLDSTFVPTKITKYPFTKTTVNHNNNTQLDQASILNYDLDITAPFATNLAVSDTLTWSELGKINFKNKPHADYPEGVMYPIVNKTLKAKKGKQVTISGFIIPIDDKSYALSKNVFAQCFFCGQAGPETIMGIQFKNLKKRLKTDQYVTLVGNFRYNETDVEDWIYHIDNAVIVKGG